MIQPILRNKAELKALSERLEETHFVDAARYVAEHKILKNPSFMRIMENADSRKQFDKWREGRMKDKARNMKTSYIPKAHLILEALISNYYEYYKTHKREYDEGKVGAQHNMALDGIKLRQLFSIYDHPKEFEKFRKELDLK
jgi:hypothetical protein